MRPERRNYFPNTASLLVYLNHGSSQVTGAVTANTLASPNPQVQNNLQTVPNGGVAGTVTVDSSRNFTIAGYVNTSHGQVTTAIAQSVRRRAIRIWLQLG